MGRPPLPEDEKRSVRQQVLLTLEEREVLERASEVLGLAMGDVLRRAGLEFAQEEIRKARRRVPGGTGGRKVRKRQGGRKTAGRKAAGRTKVARKKVARKAVSREVSGRKARGRKTR